MLNYSSNEITGLVNYLFKETYGQSAENFLQDSKICESIKKAIVEVRKSYDYYSGNYNSKTNYDEKENRKAYMIAYYPYYISAAYKIVQKIFSPNDANVYVDCFAGGPCPEIYGTIKALFENKKCNGVDIATYDLENEWLPYQKITCKLCGESFETDNFKIKNWLFVNNFNIGENPAALANYSRYTKKNKTVNLTARWNKQTDIFIMQNFLSHIPYTEDAVNNFLEWFMNLAAMMKRGAIFIFIDLNYGSTRAVLENFTSESDFLQAIDLKKIAGWLPSDGDTLYITHGNTTSILREKIFIGQYGDNSGLIPKKHTKYYYAVLQKI